MTSERDPESVLPLKPRVFVMLVVLAEAPAHGYRLKKDVRTRSEGAIDLGPATLYRTLHRLVERGLIEETDPPERDAGEDERRRYYRITGFGAAVLRAEMRRLEQLVDTARASSLLRGSEA